MCCGPVGIIFSYDFFTHSNDEPVDSVYFYVYYTYELMLHSVEVFKSLFIANVRVYVYH